MIDAELREALELHRAGRLVQAEAIYRRVLQVQPRNPDALHLLGMLALETGNAPAALQLISRAIALNTAAGVFRTNLGLVLQRLGRIDEAMNAMRDGLRLEPNLPGARINYAILLQQARQFSAAADVLREGLSFSPTDALLWHNVGLMLQQAGRKDEAIAAYQRTIELDGAQVSAINNLATLYRETGRPTESRELCERAIGIQPDFAAAWSNLASALNDTHHPTEAIDAYDRALALAPSFAATVRLNRAMSLLMTGRLGEGFAEYEARFELLPHATEFEQIAPRWDGSPLEGRTILLWCEQGFGDAIQFARYIKLVADRGGQVLLSSQTPLMDLMKTAPGVHGLMTKADLPNVHAQYRLLSLPALLKTETIADIPSTVPYLFATAERIAAWAKRIGTADGRVRVGVAWSGDPANLDAMKKACPFKMLAALGTILGVQFFSLQKNRAAADAGGIELIDFTGELTDFAETAALMHHLDLVISIDTAVCHLAGAMGKPVWTLLAYAADWRWMLDREDSPWYPTMRLFRQPSPGDWASVVEKASGKLQSLAQREGRSL